MAQYSNLKAYIEEKIYENGTQAITGDILQDVLKVMTDDLGEFYQTGGVASPSTDPGTPDAKVIYFATEAGTYTNFGGITIEAGEVALLIFETSWTKETLNVLSAANGGVKTANLADGAVTTEKIAGGAVETAKIANNAVTSGKVADGAIGTAKIADGAIDADKIAANAVESAKIKNGAVTEGKINDGAVTAGKIASNAVTTDKINDDAVTTAKLNDGAVTEDKIATDAVTSGKVKDGAIGTAKIAAGAVTHAKIGAGAVEESNIKDGAVTSDKIANGAVGSDQLAEGAFSAENLADGSVTTDKLADDAVTAEKIADGAVTAGKFANGSVTTIKLGSGAVTTEKIGDGMVTRQKLADSSVGTSKIIDGAVTTDKVADGAITDAKLENPVSVSQNTLSIGGNYAGEMSTTYDVTLHNSGATFASLEALLSDDNLNTLIPLAVRKGGMSIKFVQSSDNNYVQYRLTSDEWSTETEDWKGDEVDIKKEPTNDCFYLTDGNGNVLLYIAKNGLLVTKTFDSNKVANKDYVLAIYNVLKALVGQANERIDGKQDSGDYVEFDKGRDDTKLYWKDAEGNVVALIGNGHIKTGKFDSSKSLIQTQKGEENLYFTDLFGNVVAVVKNGDIRTSNFDSKVTRLLAENCYERIVLLEQDSDLEKRKMIPALSWVDDDFDTSRMSYLTIFRNWCNANDIHGDIALIPDSTIVDIPDSEHKDITDVYFKPERLNLIREFENEGFEFLVHPPHYGLYANEWNVVETPEYIRKNFAMTVRCFLDNNIYPDILVYPGGSGEVDTVKECARKYFDCAIIPSGGAVGNPRSSYSSTRYKMPRLPIVISSENTVSMIKQKIHDALERGDWVILCSHVWMFSGDGTEATDETSMTFSNLFDIITYANTLLAIKPVREVWRTRRILWDYYRNN